MSKFKIKTASGSFVFEVINARLTAIELPFLVDHNAAYEVLNEANPDEQKIVRVFTEALESFLTGNFTNIDFAELEEYWAFSFSEFYVRVYSNVMIIKPGQTLSYKEVAELSGNVKASRAVGNAMRNNPFPLLIPCHRVIGSDGKMTGYAGERGIHVKQRLLNWEKQVSITPSRFLF